MAIQLKLLVIIVFLVLSGTVVAQDNATRFNGNFPASQIRNLWQVCSFSFQQRQPQIPQPMRWDVCDCYVDVIRETLSPEEISKLDFEEAKTNKFSIGKFLCSKIFTISLPTFPVAPTTAILYF